MNEIVSQGAMRINSRVSDCLSHISKPYETRMRYIHPNTPLEDYTLDVASPVTSGPTKTLLQESPTKFQRSQNFCLFRHLDPDAPTLGDEKSRDEVIIIRVKRFSQPCLGDISCHKVFGLKNLRSNCCCAAGQTWYSAVYMWSRWYLKISSLNIAFSEILPHVVYYS